MNRSKTRMLIVTACVAMLAYALTSMGGDLEPSAPPSAGGTMKTLDQVEPRIPIQSLTGDTSCVYKITQPGSYYLTGNVQVTDGGKSAIIVVAANVTVDLMGYALIGPDTTTNCYGVSAASTVDNVTVCNGTVTNFKFGVALVGNSCRVAGVHALSNGYTGITVPGQGSSAGISLVKDCIAASNGYDGIRANGTVTDCGAHNNGHDGINVWFGVIKSSTASRNGQHGISGVAAMLAENMAFENGCCGIAGDSASLIVHNTSFRNNQSGGSWPDIRGLTGTVISVNYPAAP